MLAAGRTVAQVVQALGVSEASFIMGVQPLAEPVRRHEGRGGPATPP